MAEAASRQCTHLAEHIVTWIVEFLAIGTEISVVITNQPEWALDITRYLNTDEVLGDKDEAQKVRNRAVGLPLVDQIIPPPEVCFVR